MAAEVYFTGSKSTWGNKKVAIGTLTLSGIASGACQVLGYIEGAVVGNKVIGAATYAVAYNEMSGTTAADGWIHIKSATAGDVFSVIAFGR